MTDPSSLSSLRDRIADRLDACHTLEESVRNRLGKAAREIELDPLSVLPFERLEHEFRRQVVLSDRDARALHQLLVTDAPAGAIQTALQGCESFPADTAEQLMDLLRANRRSDFMESLADAVIATDSGLQTIEWDLKQAVQQVQARL